MPSRTWACTHPVSASNASWSADGLPLVARRAMYSPAPVTIAAAMSVAMIVSMLKLRPAISTVQCLPG